MADLGDETTVAGSNEKVLCVLRAHHDASFDMTPGFSTPAQRYRFEDDHGRLSTSLAAEHERHRQQAEGHAVVQEAGMSVRTSISHKVPTAIASAFNRHFKQRYELQQPPKHRFDML